MERPMAAGRRFAGRRFLAGLADTPACPYLLVGWLWFLGTLVPVIGLVQVGSAAMADRYTYFPLVGVFIAVAFGVRELANRFQFPKTAVAAAAVLIAGWRAWFSPKTNCAAGATAKRFLPTPLRSQRTIPMPGSITAWRSKTKAD